MRPRYSFSSRKTGTIEGTNQHRVHFPKLVREIISKSDIVLEILDARFFEKTRNPDFEKMVHGFRKKLIFVFNKADLVDINDLKLKIEKSELKPYSILSCKNHEGMSKMRNLIKMEAKKLNLGREAYVGVIGYPNTGKSSIINFLVGRHVARTSKEAGFTKGVMQVKLSPSLFILDSPGIIPEAEYSPAKNFLPKHIEIGVRTYDKIKNPDLHVSWLMSQYPGVF